MRAMTDTPLTDEIAASLEQIERWLENGGAIPAWPGMASLAPARAYPGLRLDPARMPMLPHSLPVMASLALVPPLWRRRMDRRVARLRASA